MTQMRMKTKDNIALKKDCEIFVIRIVTLLI